MAGWNVIVTAWPGCADAAASMCAALQGAWGDRPSTKFCHVPIDVADVDETERVDAVVLVADGDTPQRTALPFLARMEERGIAVVALVDGAGGSNDPFSFAGTIAERRDVEISRLCSLLRGVLHRQAEVLRLRDDLALSQRYHGGLKGEMARMHEEMQLAAMVQREFLPREIPHLYGISAAALWRPANYVSGDLYDVSRLDEDHIGLFLADAVGHGVPAALMTMVICRSLTTKTTDGASYKLIEPADVLTRLNHEMIHRPGRTSRFATAVYALIDCRSRTMRIAGAGHPPPLLFRDGADPVSIETSGGLLGVFEDETYDQVEVELSVDDCMLFYSDGFEQAFPRLDASAYERRLPTQRYLEEFGRLPALESADAMIQHISSRVDDQCGSLHQADDLTLICLHAGSMVQPEHGATQREGTKSAA